MIGILKACLTRCVLNKWTLYCRHFLTGFLDRNCTYFNANLLLFGDKPLSDSMLTVDFTLKNRFLWNQKRKKKVQKRHENVFENVINEKLANLFSPKMLTQASSMENRCLKPYKLRFELYVMYQLGRNLSLQIPEIRVNDVWQTSIYGEL